MFKSDKKVFQVEGMKCEHCANKVINTLEKIENIKKVKVDLKKGEVTCLYKDSINEEDVIKAIEDLGYIVK